ncbi:hypothetical protein PRK78_001454 [Emydomyces testavorans]|uniref:Uncharacterized protein n=1 Tax=Emydomyces testavorans TaxID=2070801 RepID=A0AAF0DCK0_9EURO|nr:hypothetical protein PRK78_001454 [Emydomyces testavorans]
MAHSIAIQTAQAACLSALSNIIAQYFAAYKAQDQFSFEFSPFAKYVLYGIINTPLNCLWQEYLEHKFPAQDANRSKKENRKQPSGGRMSRNLAIKFGLDQTVGAVMNIVLFIFVRDVLNGIPVSRIWQGIIKVLKYGQDFFKIYISGLIIWPLVSLVSFAMLPVERRVVFGCAAGVVWGAYLSLVAMGEDV